MTGIPSKAAKGGSTEITPQRGGAGMAGILLAPRESPQSPLDYPLESKPEAVGMAGSSGGDRIPGLSLVGCWTAADHLPEAKRSALPSETLRNGRRSRSEASRIRCRLSVTTLSSWVPVPLE